MENTDNIVRVPVSQKNVNQMKKQKWKTYGFYFSVAFLPVLQFIVFYIIVNFNSIVLSLKTYDIDTGEVVSIGFEQFRLVFDELRLGAELSEIIMPIKNSFVSFFFTTIIGLPCGLIFSYYIFKKMPLHNFFKVVLFVPSIVSSIVMTMVFRAVMNNAIPSYVELITGTRPLGLLTQENEPMLFPMIIFYNIWVGFGTQILMYVSAMGSISESTIEAAHIDGANLWQEFIHVVFPSVYPTFVVFITTHVAALFMNQLSLFPFYGKNAIKPIKTVGYYLYVGAQADSFTRYPFYSAIGILATIVTLPLVFVSRWALNKFGPSED